MFFLSKPYFFRKKYHEYHHSITQFGSRSGPTLSGLAWVKTVCISYQQKTLVAKAFIMKYIYLIKTTFTETSSKMIQCDRDIPECK